MTGDVGEHLVRLRARMTWAEIARRAEVTVADIDSLRGKPCRSDAEGCRVAGLWVLGAGGAEHAGAARGPRWAGVRP